jgi:enoyl-CoA hydratase/carnithine racemase
MALIDYRLEDDVALITLQDGENRFNPPFLDAFLAALDDIEARTAARTLVVASAHDKIWCNGIDLQWLVPILQRGELDAAKAFFHHLNRLLLRLLTFPALTVAAITGHAFAGGAIMACAFDFRFMRSDRGFLCLPEVDLGIPFLPGMNALLRKAIPRYQLEAMQYTGCRLTAEECARHHIVRQACPQGELLPEAMGFARSLGKQRAIVSELKRRLNQDAIQAIEVQDPPYIESGEFHIGA